MKHRTFTEGMIFRIVLIALGAGIVVLPGRAAYASVPARTGGWTASGPASASGKIDVLSPQCHADVSITVLEAPDPVPAGSDLTYTLTVTNHGPEKTTKLRVTDTLPDGTTFQALQDPSGWACTTPQVGAAGPVTCTIDSLDVGPDWTTTFTLTVRVAPDLPGGTVLANTANVNWAYDTAPANNTSTTSTRVTANTITTITNHTPHPSLAGHPVRVEFSVTPALQAEGTPSGNVTVTDGVDSCTGTVAEGACTLFSLTTLGQHPLAASYAGDADFAPSVSAAAPHTVNTPMFLPLVTRYFR